MAADASADFRCHDYTLILIGQIRTNEKDGLAPFDAVIEATVHRSRPVILTALAALLTFIPLNHSVFWETLAYTLIGGTFGGTVLTLVFLPALYAIWFKIKPVEKGRQTVSAISNAEDIGAPGHSSAIRLVAHRHRQHPSSGV